MPEFIRSKFVTTWSLCVCLVPLVTGSIASGQDTLESIDRVRGGRHWIDAKTDPPRAPMDSQAAFRIEPGFQIELVASEPIVRDPVAVAFDDAGQMFVVEYSDYPIGPKKEGDPPLSKVVMLQDGDGDGVMDQRHVFADQLNFAHSLLPIQGGILVGAQSQIIFLKDTNGDHHADVREVWFDGFVAAHPQMQIGNPRWGMDNSIYLNYGPGTIVRKRNANGELKESAPVVMPRLDFRFDPLTMEFGSDNGMGQFGNTVDKYGDRFYTTNRNPIMMTMLTQQQARRNPYVTVSKGSTDVGPSGGDTRVYPLVAMKSNWLAHAGTHTSACGVTAYRGSLFSDEPDVSSVFVCEPVGHLVTRTVLFPEGAGLNARRVEPKADFLASRDTWFRPASLATGPDDALYLADMYRLWVEHPKFLPPEIAERIDWRAGEDRGRIWRVVPTGKKPRSYVPPSSNDDLLSLIQDANGWRRQLAQRLIVEGQKKELAPALRQLLEKRADSLATKPTIANTSALARLHAFWTLNGLGVLTAADIESSLADPNMHVRMAAVRLSAARIADNPKLAAALVRLANDPKSRVRYQVALALGTLGAETATTALARIGKSDGHENWFATAILTSSKERCGAILRSLVQDREVAENPDYADFIRRLAEATAVRGNLVELREVLLVMGEADDASGVWWQTAALRGLATGLPRYRGDLGRLSLALLLNKPPVELAEHMGPIRKLMIDTKMVALDANRPIGDRVSAIELLAYQSADETLETLNSILSTGQAAEVQRVAVEGLRRIPAAQASEVILRNWPALGPTVRGPALEVLMARDDTTMSTLTAMAKGTIASSAVGIDRRVRLLQHKNSEIQKLAIGLFGGAVSANRAAVAKEYESALTIAASVEGGKAIFTKNCSQCHRIDGIGHQVGPDISDVRNRARDALLYDILDPNRKVEPSFNDYTIVLEDGRVVNGLLMSETTANVVLRQAEGKELTIPRDQIELLQASGKSLMPEGIEKTVSVQQMADLLEFLKQR